MGSMSTYFRNASTSLTYASKLALKSTNRFHEALSRQADVVASPGIVIVIAGHLGAMGIGSVEPDGAPTLTHPAHQTIITKAQLVAVNRHCCQFTDHLGGRLTTAGEETRVAEQHHEPPPQTVAPVPAASSHRR